VRFLVVPADGQPFIHDQDAPLRAGATFFHPPHEPGKQGFFRVTAVEETADPAELLVRVERVDE